MHRLVGTVKFSITGSALPKGPPSKIPIAGTSVAETTLKHPISFSKNLFFENLLSDFFGFKSYYH